MSAGATSSPVPLIADHDVAAFVCQHDSLSQWLVKRALANAAFVCAAERQVVGYYALSAGSVMASAATGRLRRNMPGPLPVIVLGRLAVHTEWSRRSIGSGLMKDAVLRSIQASELIGVRALLCHAIDDDAASFYLKYGFVPSPLDSRTLMLGLREAG
jgi:predicted N-acetyltransferase YhbS